MTRIAIFHAGDPLGFVPSGIDSFVRGILRWAPQDLEYTWFGGTSQAEKRPQGHELRISGVHRDARYIPLVSLDPSGHRSRVPLTLHYLWALRRFLRRESVIQYDILDFHRPEPVLLFRGDSRPKNLVLHQDMSVIRRKDSDIRWRHMPWLYESMERKVFRHVNRVFCVRESAVERYRAAYEGEAIAFEFIPTWVDTECFAPPESEAARDECRARIRDGLGLARDTRLLVFVGRLDRQKNPILLLEAVAAARVRSSDLTLALIGDGVLRPEIEKWIKSNSMGGSVRLLGALPRERIAAIHRASDLFVLSSAYEGMPIAVLEALACGLPVVSTDVGEIRRVVKAGLNGWISEAQTTQAFADAIVLALMKLDFLRGAPCTASVRNFGPEAVLGRIYENHRSQARV